MFVIADILLIVFGLAISLLPYTPEPAPIVGIPLFVIGIVLVLIIGIRIGNSIHQKPRIDRDEEEVMLYLETVQKFYMTNKVKGYAIALLGFSFLGLIIQELLHFRYAIIDRLIIAGWIIWFLIFLLHSHLSEKMMSKER